MEPTPELIDALRRDKIDAARRMSAEQKFLASGSLFDAVVERMLAGIRMQHPNVSEEDAMAMLRQRLAIARRLENRS
ncbi:MAG: hypothetical protein ACHRHE_14145 [Tepidisphaerales bacterium]